MQEVVFLSRSEQSASQQLAARLRAVGLRVTAPRLAVLAALDAAGHPCAEELTAAARARVGAVSHQAVYDVLHAFERVGLVRCIEPAGHPTRYETRVGDNHHHLICRSCGAITDIPCALGQAPCLTPTDGAGYQIGEAEVTYWGLCPSCQPPTPSTARPDSPARRTRRGGHLFADPQQPTGAARGRQPSPPACVRRPPR